MTSITTWIRLEPQSRDPDFMPGVEARLHDPLWLVARQWQLGELDGEDGGSAVIARARFDIGRIHGIAVAGAAPAAYDPRSLPIAAAIEASGRAAPRPIADVRAKADAGRTLLRRLARDGLAAHGGAFLATFPIAEAAGDLDEDERRFVAAVRSRAPDGEAAAAALRMSLPELPDALAIPPAARSAVAAACAGWLADDDAREVAPPAGPAWRSDRLEYAATAHASLGGREIALDAVEHHGGALDWARFATRDLGPSLAPIERGVATAVPAGVQYRGMPARRYWELEDGSVDWNAVDAGPGDIGRMLLVDFAVAFSDDWLIMPIEVDADTLVRVTSLVVTDTFGVRTVVPAAAGGPWRMFSIEATAAPVLFAAQPAALLVGPALEDVAIATDEQANLAWAIERRRARADGDARDAPPEAAAVPATGEQLRYRVGTSVPPSWHPLAPVAHPDGLRLSRARIPGATQLPRTQIVDDLRTLAAEELAGGVARVTTRYRLARRADGRIAVWRAFERETVTRTGMPSSGMVFDTLER